MAVKERRRRNAIWAIRLEIQRLRVNRITNLLMGKCSDDEMGDYLSQFNMLLVKLHEQIGPRRQRRWDGKFTYIINTNAEIVDIRF
jgi:hypothetical protein